MSRPTINTENAHEFNRRSLEVRRRQARMRKALILEDLDKGFSKSQVAKKHGVSRWTVWKYAKEEEEELTPAE